MGDFFSFLSQPPVLVGLHGLAPHGLQPRSMVPGWKWVHLDPILEDGVGSDFSCSYPGLNSTFKSSLRVEGVNFSYCFLCLGKWQHRSPLANRIDCSLMKQLSAGSGLCNMEVFSGCLGQRFCDDWLSTLLAKQRLRERLGKGVGSSEGAGRCIGMGFTSFRFSGDPEEMWVPVFCLS